MQLSRRVVFLFRGSVLSYHIPSRHRWISSTSHLNSSWMDKVKGVFTGQKTASETATPTAESFTLLRFAEELSKARKMGTLKQYIVGRSSEATFADAFEKQEAIIRYLGGFDPTGENIQTSQKQEAAKQCNCTIADVENALAKFTWAKEAQRKIEKLKEEGKPMPKSLAEVLWEGQEHLKEKFRESIKLAQRLEYRRVEGSLYNPSVRLGYKIVPAWILRPVQRRRMTFSA